MKNQGPPAADAKKEGDAAATGEVVPPTDPVERYTFL